MILMAYCMDSMNAHDWKSMKVQVGRKVQVTFWIRTVMSRSGVTIG